MNTIFLLVLLSAAFFVSGKIIDYFSLKYFLLLFSLKCFFAIILGEFLPRWDLLVNVRSRTNDSESILEVNYYLCDDGICRNRTYGVTIPETIDPSLNGTVSFYAGGFIPNNMNVSKVPVGIPTLIWKGGMDHETIQIPYVALEYHGIDFNETLIYAYTKRGAFIPLKKEEIVRYNVMRRVSNYSELELLAEENRNNSASMLTLSLCAIMFPLTVRKLFM